MKYKGDECSVSCRTNDENTYLHSDKEIVNQFLQFVCSVDGVPPFVVVGDIPFSYYAKQNYLIRSVSLLVEKEEDVVKFGGILYDFHSKLSEMQKNKIVSSGFSEGCPFGLVTYISESGELLCVVAVSVGYSQYVSGGAATIAGVSVPIESEVSVVKAVMSKLYALPSQQDGWGDALYQLYALSRVVSKDTLVLANACFISDAYAGVTDCYALRPSYKKMLHKCYNEFVACDIDGRCLCKPDFDEVFECITHLF